MSDDTQAPAGFLMTPDEMKLLYREQSLDQSTVQANYQMRVARTHERFGRFKKEFGKTDKLISWDTLSYLGGDGVKLIDITVVLQGIDRFTGKVQQQRVLCSFGILNDRLILSDHTLRSISDLHYDLHALEVIHSERRNALYKKHRKDLFTSSEGNVVPFLKKKKWGLLSLQTNQVVVPARYDSIAPFMFDYYHVVSAEGHNLLDKNFKPLYAKALKHIRKGNDGYYVLEEKRYVRLGGDLQEIFFEAPVEERVEPQPTLAEKLFRAYYEKPYRLNVLRDVNGIRNNNVIQVLPLSSDSILAVFTGYDYLDPHGAYLAGRDTANNAVIATYTGKVLFKTAHVGTYDSPGYERIYDKKKRLFGVYCPYTNMFIAPRYRYIQPVDRDRFFIVVTKDNKLGYVDARGKELF